MKKYICILFLLISLSIYGQGEVNNKQFINVYNTGVDLENQGLYKQALKCFLEAYNLGETCFAPFKIAEFYSLGKGTEKDVLESNKWLLISANGGLAIAQRMIADVYYYGLGGWARNISESAKWYLKAAEQGLPEGQYYIALAYLEGEGVPTDFEKGIMWLKKAAENNVAEAQDVLASSYAYGRYGLEKDINEFVKWSFKAAENGCAASQGRVGSIYLNGLGGVKADKNEAVRWFKIAAAKGDQFSIQKLSELGY